MRKLCRSPRRAAATLAGLGFFFLAGSSAHAQFYPVPGAPVGQPVMYAPPVTAPPLTMPAPAAPRLTGDYLSWGWGRPRERCNLPSCPAPEPAPQPAPAPAPAAKPMPQPEPIRPPVEPPAPPVAQPPTVLQPSEPETGPALGASGYALATPNMIGDATGSGLTSIAKPIQVQVTQNAPNTSLPAIVNNFNQTYLFSVPDASRGPFKVAENESPRPVDRIFAYYNFYRVQLAIVNPLGPGTDAYTHFDLHRETVGFEKLIFDDNTSIEVRLPFFQTGGNQRPFNATLTGVQDFDDAGPLFSTTTLTGTPDFEQQGVCDITVVFKHAWLNDRDTGEVGSYGLAVTLPTGPGLETVDGTIHDVLLQPWIGGIHYFSPNFFMHNFFSLVIPTDSRDVMISFNDVGFGWWALRRGEGSFVQGIVPTLEAHVNIPLTHRGSQTSPIGMADQTNVVGGVTFLLGNRSTLCFGAGTPLTGPQPFDVEGIVEFNYRF